MSRLVDGVLITDDQLGQKYSCPVCEYTPSRIEIRIKGWGKRQKLMKLVRDHKKEKHPRQASLFDYAASMRFNGQIRRMFNLMKDARYRTLAEITEFTGDPEASISANLRHLRKNRFGNHIVDKQRRGKITTGLWEYRLLVNRGV